MNSLVYDDSGDFYVTEMMIYAYCGYHAYHPYNKSGLDYLGNAGRPGNWWALVTDNGQPDGNPIRQKNSDPAPGFYISTTSLEDTPQDRKDPRRYVNAEAINFFVLPDISNLGAN